MRGIYLGAARLLAAIAPFGESGQETGADDALDLDIDIRVGTVAARPTLAVEFGSERRPSLARGLNCDRKSPGEPRLVSPQEQTSVTLAVLCEPPAANLERRKAYSRAT